ncbi:MAG: tyrosine-type recombinase/integrase [Sarcina sp.]
MSKFLDMFIEHQKQGNKSINTIINYRSDLKQFENYFVAKGIEIDQIYFKLSRLDIDEYFANVKLTGGRKGEQSAAQTYNRKVTAVKMIYSYLENRDIIEKSKASHLGALKLDKDNFSKESTKYLTREEVVKIKEVAGNLETYVRMKHFQIARNKLMIEILVNSGLRNEEMRELKLDDIDFENKIMYVNIAKGNSERVLALSDRCLQYARDYIMERAIIEPKVDNLFISIRKKALTGKDTSNILNTLMTSAGMNKERIKQITPHKLRHTFGTLSVQAGVDIYRVSNDLGHKSVDTTNKFYVHQSIENIVKNRIDLGI